MKNRMESFQPAKTGVSPKTVIKHTKKEHQQKVKRKRGNEFITKSKELIMSL